MKSDFQGFPQDLLRRALLRGNEYSWSINDIPNVISTASSADLVSIGGQLQFRLPSGETCECYWVAVDTYRSVPKFLPWCERVERTAAVALADFSRLLSEYDLVAEGRRGFAALLDSLERQGGDPKSSACFVWYVLNAERAKQKGL